MLIEMLKGKIHRARVTQAELNYVGSVTIDRTLMDAAGILEYEKVQIADVDNGERLETYVPNRRCGAVREHRRQGDHHGLRAGNARRGAEL